jgi:hypothetical protein
MSKYHVLKDYTGEIDSYQVEFNARAIVAVFRYRHPITYDRSSAGQSSPPASHLTELRGGPYIITNDIIQLQVQTNKSSPIGQLSLSLRPGQNYLSEILPGDFVFAWMVQDAKTFENVLNRLKKGDACNGFLDGLKFYGRLSTCRKSVQQTPDGKRHVRYTMTASSFTEFDASTYYEPHFAGIQGKGAATQWLNYLGIKINEILTGGDLSNPNKTKGDKGSIAINKVLPVLLHTLLGTGVPSNLQYKGDLPVTAGLNNPNAFKIPPEVAKVFGLDGAKKFIDVLNFVHGVQDYQPGLDNGTDSISYDTNGTSTTLGDFFNPNTQKDPSGFRFTRHTQLGQFLPAVPSFAGQKNVWSILHQFLNPAINEIYTTLRTDYRGLVLPSLICRQLPFSSGVIKEGFKPALSPVLVKQNQNEIAATQKDLSKAKTPARRTGLQKQLSAQQAAGKDVIPIEVTRMIDLPRWVIHPVLIRNLDVGRSDAMRFNFIFVRGEDGMSNPVFNIVRNPPVYDEFDAARFGLRPYMQSINCSPSDLQQFHGHMASAWQYLLADILMGQQLTLTGSLDSYGIQQPICVGDNIELDETLFHIEGVNHSFNQADDGRTGFTTGLSLTHGVNATQSSDSSYDMYRGLRKDDQSAFDPRLDVLSTLEQPDNSGGFETDAGHDADEREQAKQETAKQLATQTDEIK